MVQEIIQKRSKEAVEEDVQRLREWLQKQPHLPQNVEHDILMAFVYGTSTLEVAKYKLDTYFSKRNGASKLFDEIGREVNSQFREKSKAVDQCFLSNPTPEGYRVFVLSTTNCFAKEFDHLHESTRLLMMLELSMKLWPESTGGYVVFDCAGVTSLILSTLSPSILAATLSSFQDAFPLKARKAFCINAPPFIEFIVNNMFKPLLKAKVFNRIKVVSEGASFLKEYIPLEILPSNYGGNEKSIEELNEYWLNKLEENREWFQMTSKQASDEKKRPPDSRNTYGIDGTFRKLAID